MSEVNRLIADQIRTDPKRSKWLNELVEKNKFVQSLLSAARADCAVSDGEHEEDVIWHTVYDAVFSESVSRRVFTLISKLSLRFEYYDPDTTYREDVMAFANALDALVTEHTFLDRIGFND